VKLLLDTCVWGPTAEALRAGGHDVEYAGNWTEDPGDDEILARAYDEERILVTLDKDFGELAMLQQIPHHGILRLAQVPARRQADVCLMVLDKHADELFAGAIVTAERGRIRIRPADEAPPEQEGS
jgi:predicted nuclease of predicted toxin-antitoxin system